MIQVYRPAEEIEEILGRDGARVAVTDVRLADGKVETYVDWDGRPSRFSEEPWQVFR